LSSSGNRLFSDGERDLDLQKQKLNYKFKYTDAKFVLVGEWAMQVVLHLLFCWGVVNLKEKKAVLFQIENKL